MKSYKTQTTKSKDVTRNWHLYNIEGKVLGRAATEISKLLMGKNKPTYSPNMDEGDFVVVINADKVEVTGNKLSNKIYYRHSGYPGGLKQVNLKTMMKNSPEKVIELAIRGMISKNKHQQPRLRRLKVYTGQEHPHSNHFTDNKDTKPEETK